MGLRKESPASPGPFEIFKHLVQSAALPNTPTALVCCQSDCSMAFKRAYAKA